VASVFGSSRVGAGDAEYEVARLTGELLARAGWAVMTGGYRGAMEAASRGAREAGGHVIGVTVSSWADRSGPNRWVVEERPEPDLVARLSRLVAADALLAVGGGVGTLAEVALSWNLMQRGHRSAPLVLVGRRWERLVPSLTRELDLSEDDLSHLVLAADPHAAVSAIGPPPAPDLS
jgi:hypothetical protein